MHNNWPRLCGSIIIDNKCQAQPYLLKYDKFFLKNKNKNKYSSFFGHSLLSMQSHQTHVNDL